MKTAIILAGGNIASYEKVCEYLEDDTDLICVDRACNYAINHKLKIDIAIGDFDSIDRDVFNELAKNNIEKLTFNSDKDQTDLQLALDYCNNKKYSKIYLFGALGSRMDHSLANIFFLYKYKDSFEYLEIVDETNMIFLVKDSCEIIKKKGYYLSFLIAKGNPKISIKGVKWPLKSHQMILGDSLTVSNKIVDEKAYVKITDGLCFCFLSKD